MKNIILFIALFASACFALPVDNQVVEVESHNDIILDDDYVEKVVTESINQDEPSTEEAIQRSKREEAVIEVTEDAQEVTTDMTTETTENTPVATTEISAQSIDTALKRLKRDFMVKYEEFVEEYYEEYSYLYNLRDNLNNVPSFPQEQKSQESSDISRFYEWLNTFPRFSREDFEKTDNFGERKFYNIPNLFREESKEIQGTDFYSFREHLNNVLNFPKEEEKESKELTDISKLLKLLTIYQQLHKEEDVIAKSINNSKESSEISVLLNFLFSMQKSLKENTASKDFSDLGQLVKLLSDKAKSVLGAAGIAKSFLEGIILH